MKEARETRQQPLREPKGLRQPMADWEALEAERKTAAEELRDSQQRLRLMLDCVTDGIAVTDLNGVITDANQRTAEIYGFGSKQELLGKSAFDLITPRDHERAMMNMRRTLAEGSVRGIEYTLLKADGSGSHGELSTRVLKDSSSCPVGFIAIIRDITERKRMEDELRSSEEQSRILFELAPHACVLCDLRGNIIDANRVAEEMAGCKRDAIIGKNLAELGLLPPEESAKAARHSGKRRLQQVTGLNEYAINRKDGSQVIVEGKAFPVNTGGAGADTSHCTRCHRMQGGGGTTPGLPKRTAVSGLAIVLS